CSVISLLFLLFLFFLSIIPLPPIATLFPYTTLFRSHRELGAAGLDPLVVALHVVGVEHGRRLALLKHRLLIRFGRGVVVQRQLRSEEHTSELQSLAYLVCRLLLEKKKI